MQLGLMGLGGPRKPLFRSGDDGLSFRTFHEALIGFSGPIVILITTLNDERIGYFRNCCQTGSVGTDCRVCLVCILPGTFTVQKVMDSP